MFPCSTTPDSNEQGTTGLLQRLDDELIIWISCVKHWHYQKKSSSMNILVHITLLTSSYTGQRETENGLNYGLHVAKLTLKVPRRLDRQMLRTNLQYLIRQKNQLPTFLIHSHTRSKETICCTQNILAPWQQKQIRNVVQLSLSRRNLSHA